MTTPVHEMAGSGERAHSEKTERIVESACQVFLKSGYRAATVDAIAARAGVSKTTIYTRFPSKREMFAAVIRRECYAYAERMTLAEQTPSENLRASLRHVGCTLLEIMLLPRNLAIWRLIIAEMNRFPELGKVFYESGPTVTFANLSSFLDGCSAAGELRIADSGVAAQQFVSLIRGELQLRALMQQASIPKPVRDAAVDRAVTAFLTLYAAEPARSH